MILRQIYATAVLCLLCIFLLSAVNENADENEIPFSADKRKRKSPVSISQNLVMFQLRT